MMIRRALGMVLYDCADTQEISNASTRAIQTGETQLLKSGAKLSINAERTTFTISGYAHDGSDVKHYYPHAIALGEEAPHA